MPGQPGHVVVFFLQLMPIKAGCVHKCCMLFPLFSVCLYISFDLQINIHGILVYLQGCTEAIGGPGKLGWVSMVTVFLA